MIAITLKTEQAINQNDPVVGYLADKSKGSLPTIKGSLKSITSLLTSGQTDNPFDVDWSTFDVVTARALKARLQETFDFSTVNKMLSFVRGIVDQTFEQGQIDAEQYLQVKRALKNVTGVKMTTGRLLTDDEINALANVSTGNSVKDTRDQALFWVIYTCGLRRAEVASLQVSDVDLDNRTVNVAGSKGNKTQSQVINERTAQLLADWLTIRGTDDGPLFTSVKKSGQLGKGISDRGVAILLKDLQDKAGVAHFTTHDLRRSAITKVINSQGLGVAQSFARHSDEKTTLGYYRAVKRADDLQKASEVF